jgi:hypothetical protein
MVTNSIAAVRMRVLAVALVAIPVIYLGREFGSLGFHQW